MVSVLLGVLGSTFALGFPIFVVLALTAAVVLAAFFPHLPLEVLATRMTAGINIFSLLAIPFFIYAAEIVSHGQIGRRLIRLSRALVGHLRGGMALTTVVACILFGAISGAGTAAIVAIGTLVVPVLLEDQYGDDFSIGLMISSSTIAMLIPPGIAMILYAILASTSVGAMFMAGLVIGTVLGVAFMVYSYIYAKIKRIPLRPKPSRTETMDAVRQGGWALGLPVVILGGIYGGVFTPTEAAGVSVVYAILIELVIYREMTISDLYKVSVKAATTIAMLMILIAAASALSWVMTVTRLPQLITEAFVGSSALTVLILVNVVFLIAGMLVDTNSAIMVLVPLLWPLVLATNIDPLHLGMVIVLNMAIGQVSPPFGLGLFVASGVFNRPYASTVRGTIPFILIMLAVLALVTFVPELSLWLPRALGY